MRPVFALPLVALASALAACQPVIRTSYGFEPPADAKTRACVDQCLKTNTRCWRSCDLSTPNCGDPTLYPGGTLSGQEAPGPVPAYKTPFTRFGGPDTDCADLEPVIQSGRLCKDACDGQYRQCYARCGGTVIPHPVCAAFCEERTRTP